MRPSRRRQVAGGEGGEGVTATSRRRSQMTRSASRPRRRGAVEPVHTRGVAGGAGPRPRPRQRRGGQRLSVRRASGITPGPDGASVPMMIRSGRAHHPGARVCSAVGRCHTADLERHVGGQQALDLRRRHRRGSAVTVAHHVAGLKNHVGAYRLGRRSTGRGRDVRSADCLANAPWERVLDVFTERGRSRQQLTPAAASRRNRLAAELQNGRAPLDLSARGSSRTPWPRRSPAP